MSDWFVTTSMLSAVAGLDMTMPGDITVRTVLVSGGSYLGSNLTAMANNDIIPLSRIDDMATRILAGWNFVGQDDTSHPRSELQLLAPG
jgi:hypothetical protein